ncbi:drug:proton antiporter [Marinomonas sp. 5E14-1]|uniref:drug:proton antiporter n=1 Tax=Marinomonas sp. 5E14-1 TaxID=3153922 RepID=UPI00326601ED
MDLSNFIILYVADIERSVEFYKPLLDRDPVEISGEFALFTSHSGMRFGLSKASLHCSELNSEFSAKMELCFEQPNEITLQMNLIKWRELGVTFIEELTKANFKTSFTTLDPDGHKLRIFCY